MAALPVTVEQIVSLVRQLSDEDKQRVISQLMLEEREKRPFTLEEKKTGLQAMMLDIPVDPSLSLRREDMYGDDGR